MSRVTTAEHEQFIRKTIELAITSGKKGNNTFGAVLVHNGQMIATAENTEMTGDGYGHAEYNLAIESAQQFPERVLRECTFYTSAPPCPRCAFSILAIGIKRIVMSVSYLAIGIKRIVMSVSYEGFARLIPGTFDMLSIEEIVDRLCLEDVEILGPFLEEEGLRAFEYWGGRIPPSGRASLAYAGREREATR